MDNLRRLFIQPKFSVLKITCIIILSRPLGMMIKSFADGMNQERRDRPSFEERERFTGGTVKLDEWSIGRDQATSAKDNAVLSSKQPVNIFPDDKVSKFQSFLWSTIIINIMFTLFFDYVINSVVSVLADNILYSLNISIIKIFSNVYLYFN